MSYWLDIFHKKTTFYVKKFLKYYKVTEYGDITHNSAIFITPTPKNMVHHRASRQKGGHIERRRGDVDVGNAVEVAAAAALALASISRHLKRFAD